MEGKDVDQFIVDWWRDYRDEEQVVGDQQAALKTKAATVFGSFGGKKPDSGR